MNSVHYRVPTKQQLKYYHTHFCLCMTHTNFSRNVRNWWWWCLPRKLVTQYFRPRPCTYLSLKRDHFLVVVHTWVCHGKKWGSLKTIMQLFFRNRSKGPPSQNPGRRSRKRSFNTVIYVRQLVNYCRTKIWV